MKEQSVLELTRPNNGMTGRQGRQSGPGRMVRNSSGKKKKGKGIPGRGKSGQRSRIRDMHSECRDE